MCSLTNLNGNCFEGLIAIADTEVSQEIKKKDTIYCVLIHNKYSLLKFALKAHIAPQQFAKWKQEKVNK